MQNSTRDRATPTPKHSGATPQALQMLAWLYTTSSHQSRVLKMLRLQVLWRNKLPPAPCRCHPITFTSSTSPLVQWSDRPTAGYCCHVLIRRAEMKCQVRIVLRGCNPLVASLLSGSSLSPSHIGYYHI